MAGRGLALRQHKGKTRLGWKELRRRFCDQGWRFASEGVVFTGASSVKVSRYRYRGSIIKNPLDTDTGGRHQRLTYGHDMWRARCVERRTPGSTRRAAETGPG